MAATRSRPQAERLDGARALDGLGEGRVDRGVRRGLAQVAGLGAGEVPAQPEHQRRQPEHDRPEHPPADRDRGDEGDDRGDHGDGPLGQRPAHRPAELVDVTAGAGEQVAGAGRLDHADRERECVADEVLAQLGQHLLAEHLAGQPRVAGQDRLDHEERREHGDDPVDVADRGALVHGLDEITDQPGRGQGGQRRRDVERQRGPQQPRVPAGQARGRSGAAIGSPRSGVRCRRLIDPTTAGSVSRVTTAR